MSSSRSLVCVSILFPAICESTCFLYPVLAEAIANQRILNFASWITNSVEYLCVYQSLIYILYGEHFYLCSSDEDLKVENLCKLHGIC